MSIGNNVEINGYTFCYGGGGIDIGDNCMIGANCVITSVSHPSDPKKRLNQELTYGKVVIEDNVWIGAGAVILPGVTIGENSIVAAGSVVRESVPANVVVAGVPAIIKRQLHLTEKQT